MNYTVTAKICSSTTTIKPLYLRIHGAPMVSSKPKGAPAPGAAGWQIPLPHLRPLVTTRVSLVLKFPAAYVGEHRRMRAELVTVGPHGTGQLGMSDKTVAIK